MQRFFVLSAIAVALCAATIPSVKPIWAHPITNGIEMSVGPVCTNDDYAYFIERTPAFAYNFTCLSLVDGSLKWSFEIENVNSISNLLACSNTAIGFVHDSTFVLVDALFGALIHEHTYKTAISSTGPVMNGETSVIFSTQDTTYCVATNGTTLWESTLVPRGSRRFGITTRHVVFVSVIDLTTSLVALRLTSGELDFSSSLPGTLRNQTVYVADVRDTSDSNGIAIVAFNPQDAEYNHLAAFSFATGQWIYVNKFSFSPDFNWPIISVWNGLFIVPVMDNNDVDGFNVTCYSVTTGKQVWTAGHFIGFIKGNWGQPIPPMISGGVVVFGQLGDVVGLNATTGQTVWTSAPFFSGINGNTFAKSDKHQVAVGAVAFNNATASVAAYKVNQ